MKNKKSLVALIALLLVGIVGGTYAYFQSTVHKVNTFKIADGFSAQIDETFDPESPDVQSWKPGIEINKDVRVENTGDMDMVVRVYVNEQWQAPSSSDPSQLVACEASVCDGTVGDTDERVITPNLVNTDKWLEKTENGVTYYYYKEVLKPGTKTVEFLDSVILSENLANGDAHLGKTYIYDVYADTIQVEGAVDLWPVTVSGTTVTLK